MLKLADGVTGVEGVIHTSSTSNTVNATVSGLTIDGNQSNTSGVTNGIVTGSATNSAAHTIGVEISGVELTNLSGSGLLAQAHTQSLYVIDSSAHDNSLDGFATRFQAQSGAPDSIRMESNTAYANGDDGFDIQAAKTTKDETVVVLNSDSHDNADNGIVLTGLQQPATDYRYADNISYGTVYGNGGDGILVEDSSRALVNNMDVHDNAAVGIHLTHTYGQTLYTNAVTANAQSVAAPGILIDSDSSAASADPRYNLVGNSIVGGANATFGVEVVAASANGVHIIADNAISGDQTGVSGVVGDISVESEVYKRQSSFLVSGSEGKDTLQGSDGTDKLIGFAGRDTLSGNDGNDVLLGGTGVDKLTGGAGADTFRFTSISDSYTTSSVNRDVITDFDAQADKLDLSRLGISGLGDGHDGTLTLRYYSTSDTTVLASLDADASGQYFQVALKGDYRGLLDNSFTSFVAGTKGDDVTTEDEPLSGGTVVGLAGDDTLYAYSYDNSIVGGAGSDYLVGGEGPTNFVYDYVSDSYVNDVTGTSSYDTIGWLSASEGDVVDLTALGFSALGDGHDGTLLLTRATDSDLLTLQSLDADADGNRFYLQAHATPDVNIELTGSLASGAGMLRSYTAVGSDSMDDISGTAADDVLSGLGGSDVLTGGAGADTFLYTSIDDSYRGQSDLIEDFSVTVDKLDVSALGFTGLGDGTDGTLKIAYSEATGKTYVKSFDTDADGQRFEVALEGNYVGRLDADNFVFFATSPTAATVSTVTASTASDSTELVLIGIQETHATDQAA